MPNRTIYFYDDTYCVIQEKSSLKEASKYINELIRRDQDNGEPKNLEEAEEMIKKVSGISEYARGGSVNGKPTVSNTVTTGSNPVSPAKKINHESNAPAKEEVKAKIPFSLKGDGLHTCKDCGSQLPYFKGKCKNC